MDEKTEKGLKELPLFAVGLVAFKSEGRSLRVLLCQPEWLEPWDDWLLPETTLGSEETIPQSADRLAATILSGHPSEALQQGTYARGKLVIGALTVCYVCVRPDTTVRQAKGLRYRWCEVGWLPHSRVFQDLGQSVTTAIAALCDNVQAVALLISKPYFTIVELQRAMNELRRLAGRQGQMDIRNLRRLLDGAEWLQETPDVRSDGAHRPSRLYAVKNGS